MGTNVFELTCPCGRAVRDCGPHGCTTVVKAGPAITGRSTLQRLELDSSPIPGRPGWRRDREGREWYSAAWL